MPVPRSALRDTRFSPVQLSEIPHLSCGVSLLRLFEEGRTWNDWDVGTHGIIIEFTDPTHRARRSAAPAFSPVQMPLADRTLVQSADVLFVMVTVTLIVVAI